MITPKSIREWAPVLALVITALLAFGGLVQRVEAIESKLVDDGSWRRTVDLKLAQILCHLDPSKCLSQGDR